MAAQVQSLSSPQRLLWIAKKPSVWDTGIFCFLVMRLIMLTAIYSSFLPHLQTPNNLANHSKQTFFLLSLLYLLYLENPLKNNSVQHFLQRSTSSCSFLILTYLLLVRFLSLDPKYAKSDIPPSAFLILHFISISTIFLFSNCHRY